MKLERTKNTVRNMYWGLAYQIINIVLPFIGRTMFIYILGEEYLGLNSLFSSVLGVINITELGFSSAIVYSLFTAIAKDDEKEICALMNFYKKCYRVVGTIVFILGGCMFPFLPMLIKGDVPTDVNIYIIYGLNLFGTGIAYFMYAYKHSILIAFQRTDINKRILIPLNILQYILQYIILLAWKSYYGYLIVVPIINIIANIAKGIAADKMYPQYRAKGVLEKSTYTRIVSNVKALFISKIGGTLCTSFDSVVISMCIGLSALGIYQNYYFIVSSVIGFIQLLFDGLHSGLGNSLKTETRERNWEIFNEITFVNNWILTVCSACFLCLFQPFITLWIGKKFLLPLGTVALIVANFWFTRYQYVMLTCKDAAGLWKVDQFRPLIVGIVNLLLNFMLAPICGIAGIMLATIISTIVISYPLVIRNVFGGLFYKSPTSYIKNTIISFVNTVVIVAITYKIVALFNFSGWIGFVLNGILTSILSCGLFILTHYKDKQFSTVMKRIENLIKKKI